MSFSKQGAFYFKGEKLRASEIREIQKVHDTFLLKYGRKKAITRTVTYTGRNYETVKKYVDPNYHKVALGRPKYSGLNTIVIENFIISLLEYNSTYFLKEIAYIVHVVFNIRFKESYIAKILKKLGFTHRKILQKHHYKNLPHNMFHLERFKQVITSFPIEWIISFDECHFHPSDLNRRYGYELSSTHQYDRIEVLNQDIHAKSYSLLLAIGFNEVIHFEIIELNENGQKGITSQDILKFLQNTIRRIDENQIILLDNVRSHRENHTLTWIEENLKSLFNVPYCNENQPVELCFNYIKGQLKSLWTPEQNVKHLITEIIVSIEPTTLQNFFRCSEHFWKK